MGCCIGARTSQAEAGDNHEFPRVQILQPDRHGTGLTWTYNMFFDFQS